MKNILQELLEFLEKCDDAYYNSSNPLVNDDTYDALVESLRRMDPTNDYLKKVGAKVKSDKIGRVIPMGTLSKYHKDEEVKKWLESEGGEIIVSPKYDGFAIELVYKKGRLISASTRGDGHVGEDVLDSMMKIRNVPLVMEGFPEGEIIVRGEAIIPTKYHDEIKKLGYNAMRNAVPGIVRSNRSDALMYVEFVAYEFIDGVTDRVSQREYWKEYFTVEDYIVCDSKDIETMEHRREELRASTYLYELDGIVLKTKEIKSDDLLNPSHMIAWKYKSNRETTVLREIEFNVGATGAISVIGIFDPVEFQGATLTRASFGSLDLYRKMKPAVGDVIEVSRRGDIIPWIEEVVIRMSDDYLELEECPCCHSKLVDDKCKNTMCPDRVKLKILQYIQGAKVKGLGRALVESLVDNGIVRTLSDVYDMNSTDILSLPRQGESAVEKWRNFQNKKLSPLEFLCAYPIENSGKALWETLLSRYSLSEILELSREDLINARIRGIGESKIESIVSQLEENKVEMKYMMERLNLE